MVQWRLREDAAAGSHRAPGRLVDLTDLRKLAAAGQDLDELLRGATLLHDRPDSRTKTGTVDGVVPGAQADAHDTSKHRAAEAADAASLHKQSIERLRYEAEERAYQSLLLSSTPSLNVHQLSHERPSLGGASAESAREELQMDKSHLSTVVNVLVTMAATAYGLWWWTRYNWTLGARVALCLTGALLLGVAETFLYVRYVQGVTEASRRRRERRRSPQWAKRERAVASNVSLAQSAPEAVVAAAPVKAGSTDTVRRRKKM